MGVFIVPTKAELEKRHCFNGVEQIIDVEIIVPDKTGIENVLQCPPSYSDSSDKAIIKSLITFGF